MIIRLGEYKIVPQRVGFDLVKEIEYQKVGEGSKEQPMGEMAKRDDIIDYDCSLEYCINRLIHDRMRLIEKEVDLKTFLSEYKKLKCEIKTLIET